MTYDQRRAISSSSGQGEIASRYPGLLRSGYLGYQNGSAAGVLTADLIQVTPMLEDIKVYYDYKSPFTYLALARALELETTHHVRLRFIPHELDIRSAYGGELKQRPERDWFKVRYLYTDARRFANDRGLIIRGPQKIFDSRLALTSGLYADRHGRFREYSQRIFERFFKRELDLEDPQALAAVLTEVGLDPSDFRRFADHQGEAALRLAREEADRDGVFGVPTLIVAGEMFWGHDRLKWVVDKLDAMGLKRAARS